MRYFFFFFLQISLGVILQAQPTTIFELLELRPEGCVLSASTTIQRMEAMVDASPSRPREVELPEGVNTVDELFFQLGYWLKSQLELQPELEEAQILLDEEYTFFRQGQLWGLRTTEKTVLLPQFDRVESLEEKDGFIAYKGATANVYDLGGKARFKQNYHSIAQAKEGQFIVYTPDGAGLVSGTGEVLLPAEHEQINLFSQKDIDYYHIQSNAKISFVYNINTQERIYYNAQRHDWRFLNENYALIGQRDLIDLKEKKRVFCGEKTNIRVLNAEHQFLSIALASQPNKRYLVRFDGSMASPSPYYEIGNYYPAGYLEAALPKAYQQGDSQKKLFGIIDTLGNWVLAPKYDRFSGRMVANTYFQLINRQGKTSLLDHQGDTLFPFQQSPRFVIDEKRKNLDLYYQEDGEVVGLRRNLRSGKLTPIKEERLYSSERPYEGCNEEGYIVAKTSDGELLLNPEGEPVTQVHRRIFTGQFDNTFVVLKSRPAGSSWHGPYRQLYNCDGTIRSFKVNGETVTDFYDLLILEKDFYFLRNDLETGNFLFPDGSSMYSDLGWRQVNQRLTDHYILNASGNKMGIITKDGIIVLPPSFDILHFRKDLGLLKAQLTENNIQWIKPDGSLLFDGQYDKVFDDKAGKFKVFKENLTGVVDRNGKLIIPIAYTHLYYSRGFYHATDANKKKYRFDRTGQLIN